MYRKAGKNSRKIWEKKKKTGSWWYESQDRGGGSEACREREWTISWEERTG